MGNDGQGVCYLDPSQEAQARLVERVCKWCKLPATLERGARTVDERSFLYCQQHGAITWHETEIE